MLVCVENMENNAAISTSKRAHGSIKSPSHDGGHHNYINSGTSKIASMVMSLFSYLNVISTISIMLFTSILRSLGERHERSEILIIPYPGSRRFLRSWYFDLRFLICPEKIQVFNCVAVLSHLSWTRDVTFNQLLGLLKVNILDALGVTPTDGEIKDCDRHFLFLFNNNNLC